MSQQNSEFFKEFFKKDEAGKPIAVFDIEVLTDKPGRSIKRAMHCRYVLPQVVKIEDEINRLLAGAFENNQVLETIYAKAGELHDFAGKLTSQAIYLDSADRNGWEKVKMTIMQPGTFSTLGGRASMLKDFCSNIEAEQVLSRTEDSPAP